MSNFVKKSMAQFDTLFVKFSHWKHIPYSTTNFLYLNPYIYKGKTLTIKDGTVIKKGDWIGEIHIDNVNVKSLNTSYPNLIRLLRGEIKALNRCLKEEPHSKIKAICGISVFYDIARRQGFTILPIENSFKRFLISIGENILRLGLKNSNKKTRKKFVFSKQCWLSRNEILNLK
jgi:hypothetical protein